MPPRVSPLATRSRIRPRQHAQRRHTATIVAELAVRERPRHASAHTASTYAELRACAVRMLVTLFNNAQVAAGASGFAQHTASGDACIGATASASRVRRTSAALCSHADAEVLNCCPWR